MPVLLKKDPEIAKQRLISKQAEKKQPNKEKNRLRLSAIYEVSDDTVNLLGDLKQQAVHAKGKFRDSQEYKNFLGAVGQSHLLAKEIQQKRDTAGFDLKKAESSLIDPTPVYRAVQCVPFVRSFLSKKPLLSVQPRQKRFSHCLTRLAVV